MPMSPRALACSALFVLMLSLGELTSCQEKTQNTMGRAKEIEDELLSKLLASLDRAANVLGQVISRKPNQASRFPDGLDMFSLTTSSAPALWPPLSGGGGNHDLENATKSVKKRKWRRKGFKKWHRSGIHSAVSSAPSGLAPISAPGPQATSAPASAPLVSPTSAAAGPASPTAAPVPSNPGPAPPPWPPFLEVQATLSSINSTATAKPLPEGAIRRAAYDVFFAVFGPAFNGHMTAWAVQMAGDGGRVHIIANDDGTISKAKLLASQLHFEENRSFVVGNVQGLIGPVKDNFMSRYRHRSVNPLGYEALCFWRWGVIHHYMQALESIGMELGTVFTIDADIVPVRPYSEWIPSSYAHNFGRSVSLVRFVNGAAAAWTRAELSYYWLFLYNIYHSSATLESIANKWGERIWQRLHFSDMHAQNAFVDALPARRCSALTVDSFQAALTDENRERWNEYDCAPLGNVANLRGSFVTLVNGTTSDVYDLRLTSPRFTVHQPLCFLHFGGGTKGSIKTFTEFLWRHVHGSTFNF